MSTSRQEKMMKSESDYDWLSRDFSLKEFVQKFRKFSPFLVKCTSGYLGRDGGVHSLSAGEVRLDNSHNYIC